MADSEILYLFDSKGKWIAFKRGKYLFNRNGRWIGWFPEEGLAVDTDGKYLGTIYQEDRLLVNLLQKKVSKAAYPGYPEYPGLQTFPGFKGFSPYIPNTEDIKEKRLE